jgi:hypothetical protein
MGGRTACYGPTIEQRLPSVSQSEVSQTKPTFHRMGLRESFDEGFQVHSLLDGAKGFRGCHRIISQ